MGTLSSALEHAVPEQMFATPENPGEAISAVKALSKASQAGQRIYHITPANQASTLPNIHHNSLVMNEIQNALNAGKEVITHTDAVSVPGWSGAGYIIYDPVTGDGAYKIGGGENGGFLILLVVALTAALLVSAVILGGPIGLALGVWAGIGFYDFIQDLRNVDSEAEFNQLIFLTVLSLAVSFIPFAKIGAEGVGLAVFLEGFLYMWGEAWFG